MLKKHTAISQGEIAAIRADTKEDQPFPFVVVDAVEIKRIKPVEGS